MKKSARRKRCRAVVLWTIGGIALMQLALGLAIDAALPGVRDPEYVHRERLLHERLAEAKEKPSVVMIGSSRVQNGFDAATASFELQGEAIVFNFGIPTSGPFLERIWIERLHQSGITPDVLCIEIIPAYFNASHAPQDLRSLDGARLTGRELANIRTCWNTLEGPIKRWVLSRALPSQRHQAELHDALRIDEPRQGRRVHAELSKTDRQGWQARSIPPELIDPLKGLAHRQYDPCFQDFKLSGDQAEVLEELLARCEREGIKAALVLTPEGSEFRALYSPAMTASIDEMLARLHDRHGVPIIDARAWIDDAQFSDMHHLLPEGAKEFSVRLTKEGIAPLLRDTAGVARKSRR